MAQGSLRTDGAAPTPAAHPSRVAVVCERVEVAARGRSEHRDEVRLRELRNLADGHKPLAAQLLSVARRSGIACVEAELLRANVRMLQLCARAGFTFADDGSGGVRATWSLPFGS